jgi:hypothetical protein
MGRNIEDTQPRQPLPPHLYPRHPKTAPRPAPPPTGFNTPHRVSSHALLNPHRNAPPTTTNKRPTHPGHAYGQPQSNMPKVIEKEFASTVAAPRAVAWCSSWGRRPDGLVEALGPKQEQNAGERGAVRVCFGERGPAVPHAASALVLVSACCPRPPGRMDVMTDRSGAGTSFSCPRTPPRGPGKRRVGARCSPRPTALLGTRRPLAAPRHATSSATRKLGGECARTA